MALKPLEYATPAAPHKAASADDRRADRRHQDKRPERAPAEIIVVHVPHLADNDKADEHHRDEVSCDDEKVDGVNLIMYHVKSPFFACRMVSVNTHPLFRRCPPDAASAFGEKLHNAPARGQISHEDHKVSAPQSRIRPRRYDLLSASADGDDCCARRAPEFELAKASPLAVPVFRDADAETFSTPVILSGAKDLSTILLFECFAPLRTTGRDPPFFQLSYRAIISYDPPSVVAQRYT